MGYASLLLIGAVTLGALVLFLPRWLSWFRDSLHIHRSVTAYRDSRHTDLSLISAYHDQYAEDSRAKPLDERTYQDLDLDEVFSSIDHAVSEPGRQHLYHTLRSPHQDLEPLGRLESVVRIFAADSVAAEKVRGALGRLRDRRAGHLAHLFFGDLPVRPRFWWLFPILTASAIVCLALITMWPRAGIVWVGICMVNVFVQLTYKPHVKRFTPALHQLPGFLAAARVLGQLQMEACVEETRTLRDGANRLGALRRATSWLMFEPGQASDLAASLYEYVNLLFLLDVNAFVFATETLRKASDSTQAMFKAMGYLDTAQSIAAWRGTLPHWTTPEFTAPEKAMHVRDLIHPLLPEPVPNSFTMEGGSALITGSNMSGKSTFVRALGVSTVLAQTLHTACARTWRAPLLSVRTSIGRADSVVEGKSYYLAEVESVLALVQAKESGGQHLFLLDEIFRGTNTVERVAAGYAVLAHLNRGLDLVVVATHDLELLDLLSGGYAIHHFREQIEGDNLSFDYLIQPGPSSTRNAIALLRLMHYPETVVTDALATIDWQGRVGARRDLGWEQP